MNEKLKQFITSGINEKKLSHAFLVETNDCEQTLNNIYDIFKQSKKIPDKSIENNINVYVIRPENNNIDKNKILYIQNFISTKILNYEYKIYFIINAEKMNQTSSNKLLKVLEEPSENIIGFLITESINSIMATIKSRCELFENKYQKQEEENNEFYNLYDKIKNSDNYNVLLLKQEILKYDRINLINNFEIIKDKISKNINSSNYLKISKEYQLIDEIITKLYANTNIEMCIDKLLIEMRQ